MKIGLDIHGVIDHNPELFSRMSKQLIEKGHKVYIITGSMQTVEVEQNLKELGIVYTDFFSISDYLINKGEKVTFSNPDNPWFESDVWNRVKAEFCENEGIDFHFDDSIEYAEHFINSIFVLCIKSEYVEHQYEVLNTEFI
ncbi:MAG: hypothetical protein ACOC33_02450, partial [bacterium]